MSHPLYERQFNELWTSFSTLTGWLVLTELRLTNRIIEPWFSAFQILYQF
ncbi:MAG: hypothetical protein KME54_18475 [Tolypothrix brevis GSE-NOS-MK-07-07A]|nr:hypothetical protein [Tolypothrix brevis GSE-NOS-MK-07-07A]